MDAALLIQLHHDGRDAATNHRHHLAAMSSFS
jgi:hypothetical protein